MMQEKDMVNDYLTSLKSSMATYAQAISETSNQQLRQTLIQMRNQDENRQYTVYQMAVQKGYYQPASQANQNEVQQVRSQLS